MRLERDLGKAGQDRAIPTSVAAALNREIKEFLDDQLPLATLMSCPGIKKVWVSCFCPRDIPDTFVERSIVVSPQTRYHVHGFWRGCNGTGRLRRDWMYSTQPDPERTTERWISLNPTSGVWFPQFF